jgi:hypothetical protein
MSSPTFPELRKQFPADTNYRILRSEISVTLSSDHRRAKYAHRYVVSVEGPQPETEWEIVLPSLSPTVSFVGASDADGGLQHTIIPFGKSTRIPIKYRRELTQGSPPYEFTYSYETNARSLIVPTVRGRVVNYSEWLMPDVACDLMKVTISLPLRCRAIQSFPAANLESSTISFQYDNMRPLEVFAVSLAYHHSKLGNEVWLWVASVLASGAIGAIVGKALG